MSQAELFLLAAFELEDRLAVQARSTLRPSRLEPLTLECSIVVRAESLRSRGNVVRAAFRGLRFAIRYGPVSLRSIDR